MFSMMSLKESRLFAGYGKNNSILPRKLGGSLRRVLISILLATNVYAQQNPFVGDTTTQISEHVWAIMGFPNIGIVVGSRATLVVDTGMGPRNGSKVMSFVEK